MPTVTQQLFDFLGTRTIQAIGTAVVFAGAGYNLLYDTGTFALASGVFFLGVGLLMLADLFVE